MLRSVLRLVALGILALAVTLAAFPQVFGPTDPAHRIDLALTLVEQVGMLAIAAIMGARWAPRMGLRSHVAGLADRWRAREVGEALLIGVGIGVFTVAVGWIATALAALPARAAAPGTVLRVQAAELIYGSVCREMLLRWGVMTFIVTAVTSARGSLGPANRRDLLIAALATACVDVIWLWPAAAPGESVRYALHILVVGAPAFAFGWVYGRWSLEAAMIAHAVPQVLSAAALAAGVLAARPHG